MMTTRTIGLWTVVAGLVVSYCCWAQTLPAHSETQAGATESHPSTTTSQPVAQTRAFRLRVMDEGTAVGARVSVRAGDSQEFVYVPAEGAEITSPAGETVVTYAATGPLAKGKAAYTGTVTVRPEDTAATLKVTRATPIPFRISVVDAEHQKGKAGADVVLECHLDNVIFSEVPVTTDKDGNSEVLVLDDATYTVVYRYPGRRLPLRSSSFIPKNLPKKEYVFIIPPREALSFRIQFVRPDGDTVVPAVDVASITILRKRGGAMFPVHDGLLYLDISEGPSIDEFATGDTFRLQFSQEISRKYETPLESNEYRVGKATDEPLKIRLIPRKEGAVKFEIKSKSGKLLSDAKVYLRDKDGRTWTVAKAPASSIPPGQYTVLVWQYGYVVWRQDRAIRAGDTIACVLDEATKVRIVAGKSVGNTAGGRLEYKTADPVPEFQFLRFNTDGIAEVFYDSAYSGMALVGKEGVPPVVVPLVGNQSEYSVSLAKAEPISVTLVIGEHKQLVQSLDPVAVYWSTVTPFRKRIAKTIIEDAKGTVLLSAGEYIPFVELAGPNTPTEFMDKAILCNKVTIDEGTRSIVIEADKIVPFGEVLD